MAKNKQEKQQQPTPSTEETGGALDHGVIPQGDTQDPPDGTPDEAIAAAAEAGVSLPGFGDSSDPIPLRSDGPTLEEFVAAGYLAADYPPHGYAAKKVTTHYRVVEQKKFSLFGQIVVWKAGEVVEPAHWGPTGLARLRDAGVKLEPI